MRSAFGGLYCYTDTVGENVVRYKGVMIKMNDS